MLYTFIIKSRYSDGLLAGRPGFGFQQGQEFSVLHVVQTGSGAHPTSYPMGTEHDFLGGEAAGA
jgi:hypothetical protein